MRTKIIAHNTKYIIAENGDVFNRKHGWKLKPQINSKGYERVFLSYVPAVKGGKYDRPKAVHRLVAEAFLRKSANRTEVNHKDGNKLNNHVSNLEWCTRLENVRHFHKNLRQ